MQLTREDGKSVVGGYHEDWETIEERALGQNRWTVDYEGIFLHKPSDKCYRLYWRRGATEMQDEQPFDYEDPELIEVTQKEVMKLEWVNVN